VVPVNVPPRAAELVELLGELARYASLLQDGFFWLSVSSTAEPSWEWTRDVLSAAASLRKLNHP